MNALFVSIFLTLAAHAAPGSLELDPPWDHTPFYFLTENLPVEVSVREFPMLTASHWRVCRAMTKQAVELVEQMNNPRLGDRIIPVRHEFVLLRANCTVQWAGVSRRKAALRTRNFSGEVRLEAVSSNFVPGFNRARSVEAILTHADGSVDKLAELSPGTVFDIPYLGLKKELRLTELGRTIAEQFMRPGQELKFKITSSYSQNLEIPAADLVSAPKLAQPKSSAKTCATQVESRD